MGTLGWKTRQASNKKLQGWYTKGMIHIRKWLVVACLLFSPIAVFGQASNDLITINTWSASPDQNYSRSNSITLSGTRLQASSIAINGVLRVAEGAGNWQVVFTGLAEGTHEYEVIASDDMGQPTTPIELSFFVDTIPLAGAGFTPPLDTAVTEPISQITVHYVETGSGLDIDSTSITIYPDNASRIDCNTSDLTKPCWLIADEQNSQFFVNFSPALTDDRYRIQGVRYDRAGNSSPFGGSPAFYHYYYVNTSGTVPIGPVPGRAAGVRPSTPRPVDDPQRSATHRIRGPAPSAG